MALVSPQLEGQKAPQTTQGQGSHIWSKDTAFGTRMRQELLRGLLVGAAALTVLVVIVLTAVVLLTDLPVTFIVLVYLALMIVA